MKKMICVTVFVIITLLGIFIVFSKGHNKRDMQVEDALSSYLEAFEDGVSNDISLTIYYIDPTILTRAPVSVEGLLTFSDVRKIHISHNDLVAHYELLTRLNASNLQPVTERTGINARLYYVFETEKSDKILEVVINGVHGSAFINGIEVEGNAIFFELIAPFVDEHFIDMWGDRTGDGDVY